MKIFVKILSVLWSAIYGIFGFFYYVVKEIIEKLFVAVEWTCRYTLRLFVFLIFLGIVSAFDDM